MNSKAFNSQFSDGTDQGQREPLAFEVGYFNVDEMSFEMLLSMASEYAAIFNYYNLSNQKEGSWEELFSANEAVIMALIATSDVEQIETGFTLLDHSSLHMSAEYVVAVALTIDFWLQRLGQSVNEPATLLRSNIYDLVRSNLLPGLHTAASVAHLSNSENSSSKVGELSSVWKIDSDGGHYTFPCAQPYQLEDHDGIVQQLEMVLLKMTGVIRYLQSQIEAMVQQSLQGQSHEPAIGLFMVFLRLYEVAQKRLNRFTLRHLDFYYRDCLKTSPRGREAENLYLAFEPATATKPFIVEQDVFFSAEKKVVEGMRRYYLTAPLVVRRARVIELKTLYFQRNSLVSPECELGHVTRIKSQQRQLPPTEARSAIPLFGAAKSGIQQRGVSDAPVGFCVASPTLALKEGRREIELIIDFTLPEPASVDELFSDAHVVDSIERFRSWFGEVFSYYLLSGESFLNEARRLRLNELVAIYDDAGGGYHTLLQQPWQDLFYKLFRRPFSVSLSGESGWIPVPEYLVSPAVEDDAGTNSGLKILFSLGHNIEPIIAYDPELHGEARGCNTPMMNLYLDPEASFFSYSLLKRHALQPGEPAAGNGCHRQDRRSVQTAPARAQRAGPGPPGHPHQPDRGHPDREQRAV